MAVLAPLVFGGMVAAPLALPILPLEAAARRKVLGRGPRASGSRTKRQIAADVCRHDGLAATIGNGRECLSFIRFLRGDQTRVANSRQKLRSNRRDRLFRTGALGLPHAISGHNNYYLWGPQQYAGEVVIAVGIPLEDLKAIFGEINLAATINNEFAIPEENNLSVYICRKPKMTLQQAWPRLKFYG